jgi:MFS family permease
MLLPTLTLYLTKEGCPKEEIGVVIGTFTFFTITFMILSITIAKRFGAVRSVRFGLIIIAIGTLFFFLIHNTGSYITARLLEGAGFGITSTLSLTIASEIIPPSRMAEGWGYMGRGITMAMALGPLAGMMLSNTVGFEFMFSSMSLFSLIAAGITLTLPQIKVFYLPPEITQKKEPFHLDKRPFPAASLAVFYGVAVCSVSAYLAIYAQTEKLPSAALFFLVSTTGTVVARLFTGKIYDHKGDRLVIPPAALILLFSFALLLHASSRSTFSYYAASVIYGFGIGSLFPSIQTLAISSVPHSKRSVSVTTFFVCFDLGTGLGTVILGLFAGWFNDYRVVFKASIIFILLILISYGFFYVLPNQRRIRLVLSKKDY